MPRGAKGTGAKCRGKIRNCVATAGRNAASSTKICKVSIAEMDKNNQLNIRNREMEIENTMTKVSVPMESQP